MCCCVVEKGSKLRMLSSVTDEFVFKDEHNDCIPFGPILLSIDTPPINETYKTNLEAYSKGEELIM